MKPENHRPAIDPGDGAPLRCHFMYKDDAPKFWSRCEQDSTMSLDAEQAKKFFDWQNEHPKHMVSLYPMSLVYVRDINVCDTHYEVIQETIGKGE